MPSNKCAASAEAANDARIAADEERGEREKSARGGATRVRSASGATPGLPAIAPASTAELQSGAAPHISVPHHHRVASILTIDTLGAIPAGAVATWDATPVSGVDNSSGRGDGSGEGADGGGSSSVGGAASWWPHRRGKARPAMGISPSIVGVTAIAVTPSGSNVGDVSSAHTAATGSYSAAPRRADGASGNLTERVHPGYRNSSGPTSPVNFASSSRSPYPSSTAWIESTSAAPSPRHTASTAPYPVPIETTSIVKQLFFVHMQTELTCVRHRSHVTMRAGPRGGEMLPPLPLVPGKREVRSGGLALFRRRAFRDPCLNDALDDFFAVETIERRCDKCARTTQMLSRPWLTALPPVLVVALKRFEFDPATCTFTKTTEAINFPLSGLDMAPYVSMSKTKGNAGRDGTATMMRSTYSLFAVVLHAGGTERGHYTTLARRMRGTQWFLFDDGVVTRASCAEVSSKRVAALAYMLFYARDVA